MTRRGWVTGCVHGAATHLHDSDGPPPDDLLDQLEDLYQAHVRELAPLAGTDRIWRRLAELHQARQGDQLALL